MNRVQHEKSLSWKECHMKKWNTDKVKQKMSAAQKSAAWSECNMKQHEKRCNMKRVQEWNMQNKKLRKKSALECTNG